MSRYYDEFQEDLSWERLTSAGDIPGTGTYAAAVSIPGAKDQKVIAFTEDLVSDVTFTLPPQYEPSAGDKIDGAEVIKVASVKDVQARVQSWIAYARA